MEYSLLTQYQFLPAQPYSVYGQLKHAQRAHTVCATALMIEGCVLANRAVVLVHQTFTGALDC